MEAAWLAAVLVVPVFFNVYSTRVFEPDKIAVLRTLALACLAAWGIKAIEEGGLRRPEPGQLRAWFSQPLTLPVVALGVGASGYVF